MDTAMVAVPEDTGHSEVSPSMTDRLFQCPWSVVGSRGITRTTSEPAEEGTALHQALEVALKGGTKPVIGSVFNGITLDEDQVEAIQAAVDWVDDLYFSGEVTISELQTEYPISLGDLTPGPTITGTVDICAIVFRTRKIIVADFKGGRVFVPVIYADGTPREQLACYALGLLLKINDQDECLLEGDWTIELTIIQPRTFTNAPVVRTATFTLDDIRRFAATLLAKVQEAYGPNPSAAAGPACKYCPVSGQCRHQATAAAAGLDVLLDSVLSQDALTVSPVTKLSLEEIAHALRQIPVIEGWIKGLESAAVAALARGDTVPGFKLVQGKGRQKWKDEASASTALTFDHALAPGDVFEEPVLRSPAQIRAALAATLEGKTKKAREEAAKKLLVPLTYYPPGAVRLAPESDAAPAIEKSDADADFLPNP